LPLPCSGSNLPVELERIPPAQITRDLSLLTHQSSIVANLTDKVTNVVTLVPSPEMHIYRGIRRICASASIFGMLAHNTSASCAPESAPIIGFNDSESRLAAMLAHNEKFVREGAYRDYAVATPAPATRCVILTCMDSRLTHLLPAALNIKQGDAKIIKTAGAILSHPFGGIMRSIIVALYELRASEVFIIGHEDCGMRSIDVSGTTKKMIAAGVPADRLRVLETSGVNVHKWLEGFASVDESVLAAVEAVRTHPLVPPTLKVTGLVIDPNTGALRLAKKNATHIHH
jgi:carbonic anhydrase